MFDVFRRPGAKGGADSGAAEEVLLRSHIFQKFLKRLSAREHPTLLDLGALSGPNIEIFARIGCRVKVEDLVSSIEEKPGAPEPFQAAELPVTPEVRRPDERAPSPPPAAPPGAVPGRPAGASSATAPPQPPIPGARPSRRIVLPPRSIGRTLPARPAAKPQPPYRTPLATALSYPDESLDALVAWDLLNYYDTESVRRIASEVCRVLKPGGIVFAYFHSRNVHDLEAPRRFRIVDEKQLSVEPGSRRPLRRHVLQNRDIERLFAGLRIRELYFLKNGLREMLLEKTQVSTPETPSAARPRPRFQID